MVAKHYRPKSREEIARNMSAIRSRENKVEAALRSMVHREGFRFRKYSKNLPGKPDFVFPRERVAVFVDGDFWHGRMVREQGPEILFQRIKSATRPYWVEKLQRNIRRDETVTAQLKALDWIVVRMWESEVKADPKAAALHVTKTVRQRRRQLRLRPVGPFPL